jgi:hypothetical protein
MYPTIRDLEVQATLLRTMALRALDSAIATDTRLTGEAMRSFARTMRVLATVRDTLQAVQP